MKIGVFGGTFDPFTCAHYEIVKEVLGRNLVDKVVVIPTVVDYYRKDKSVMFDLEERSEILSRWFKNEENVILDFHEYDLARKEKSNPKLQAEIENRRYIHMLDDLIERTKRALAACDDTEWFSIVGGDSWNRLNTWYEWEKLFEKTKFIAVRRNGDPLTRFVGVNYDKLYSAILVDIDEKFADVSATSVRKRLEDKQRITVRLTHDGPRHDYRLVDCLELYLDEIDEYLKSVKTCNDRYKEHFSMDRESARESDSMKAYNKIGELERGMHLDKCDELLVHTPIFNLMKGPEVEEGFSPFRIESNDWVTVVVEKDGEFLMEKQFRHGLKKEFEEFPCGMVEDGEQPIVAALRELKEETGITPERYSITYLGKFAANPAFMTNYMHYFYISLNSFEQIDQQLDPHEHITWYWKDKNAAFSDFLKSHGSALGGSCWMLLILNNIIDEWEY